jgi:hypothetical protein
MLLNTMMAYSSHGAKGVSFHNLKNHGAMLDAVEGM